MSTRVHNNYSMARSGSLSGRQSFGRRLRTRCDICIRIFKWLPVLFIVSVLSWGYYAYVIQLCVFNIDLIVVKIFYLSIFHVLYAMTLWSYWQTIFTDSAHIPRDFWLPPTEKEKLLQETNEENQKRLIEQYVFDRSLPIQCRAYNGMYRICENCFMIKPDRAHHCSVCDQCVLKMDHHCPWVNHCVSFSNYKFFILFLGYAFTLCLFSAITSFPYFLKFWKNELTEWGKFHILFLFFVSIMFAISLISLFGYHIYLVLLNRSTLESFRAPVFAGGPDRNAYNLGKYKNFCQVFGENRISWFLPLYTSKGSGIVFEQKNDYEDNDKLLNGDDEDREEEAIIERTSTSGIH
ncbi:palmitoyltransferase ZDHHC20-B-like isoform X2 [Oppia nitens]|uniref:palmitoyltransferase ZDHHC20-B-like isoform X2 n=1 Tax=Oppia nitens TaxID=1686743 RepID=UPI0023DB660F|nr:palmitoyltransferase ZDHHC20-B-like isoform X2 [Oppia nitens]